MTLDGLRNLMLDDLGRHLERLAREKRDDVLTQVVELVVGRGVEKTTDAYLAAAESVPRTAPHRLAPEPVLTRRRGRADNPPFPPRRVGDADRRRGARRRSRLV